MGLVAFFLFINCESVNNISGSYCRSFTFTPILQLNIFHQMFEVRVTFLFKAHGNTFQTRGSSVLSIHLKEQTSCFKSFALLMFIV